MKRYGQGLARLMGHDVCISQGHADRLRTATSHLDHGSDSDTIWHGYFGHAFGQETCPPAHANRLPELEQRILLRQQESKMVAWPTAFVTFK